MKNVKNVIITLPVHYEQERIDKKDNNNGLLYGIYYYNISVEDLNTDNAFNNDVVNVEWFETESERNLMLQRERESAYKY